MSHEVRPSPVAALLAAALFALIASWLLAGVWQAGPSDHLARASRTTTGEAVAEDYQFYNDADTVFVAWLAARNADTMTRRPFNLFDAEHCAPAEKTLAFGEPIFTFGALTIPAWLATGNPVAAYNATTFLFFVLSAMAMYALVAEWAGSAPAGVVAGLLYGFHAERIADVTHLFLYDTTWVVLALLFARRWLAHGRMRDVAALALCGALQIGTSFYPILAALLVSAPVAAALLAGHGLQRKQRRQLPLLVVAAGLTAYAMFGPYLEVRDSTETLRRSEQLFAAWSWFVPHREAGIAWSAVALALVALLACPLGTPNAVVTARGFRWCVALGAMLAAAAATGPNQPETWRSLWQGGEPFGLPNIYAAISRILPGLDAVRVPARINTGYHLGLCLLAGLGVAALLETTRAKDHASSRRRARWLAAGLIAITAVETVVLLAPIRPSEARASLLRVEPDPADLALFRSLEESGNSGPLLELPVGDADREYVFRAPARILASVYHHRRTSACYGSFHPPGRAELRRDSLNLLDPAARARICGLGFTTAIVHLDTPLGRHFSELLSERGMAGKGPIRYLGSSPSLTAFALCEPDDEH